LEGVTGGGSERFRSLEAELSEADARDLLGHGIWVRMVHQMLGSGLEIGTQRRAFALLRPGTGRAQDGGATTNEA
jgi:hypothetical protein